MVGQGDKRHHLIFADNGSDHLNWDLPPLLHPSHPRHLLHRHRSHKGRRSPGTTSAREKWTPPGPSSTRSVCTPSGALAATDTCCCSRLGPIQQTTRAAASTDGLQADFVSPDMQDKYNSDMQDKYKYKVQIQGKNTQKCIFAASNSISEGTWTNKH